MTGLFACAGLAGCASIPDDNPFVEKLDTETGTTITRLGRPLELYRETFLQNVAGRFAFLGPFETNSMGAREPYLWIAVPVETADEKTAPALDIDGTPVTLGAAARTPDVAGLGKSPYKVPTPWSTTYYFKIDADVVARLGAAKRIAVHIEELTKNGPEKTEFFVDIEPGDSRLAEFAAR